MLTAVTGINWGDEGKGRVIDLLAERADIVVRYQGGNNAGHTVVTKQGKFILNLLPSGILHPNVVCVLADGMVVDLEHLSNEIADIRGKGVSVTPQNFKLSARATISMPWHRIQDDLEEERLAQSGVAFGSTRRGIAYAYSDKYRKKTLRLGDLLHLDEPYIQVRLKTMLEAKNLELAGCYHQEPMSYPALLAWCQKQAKEFLPYICDTGNYLDTALSSGKQIVLEAQLGAMRDIDYGIFPYTSSSTTIAAYGPIGAGITSLYGKLSSTTGETVKAGSSQLNAALNTSVEGQFTCLRDGTATLDAQVNGEGGLVEQLNNGVASLKGGTGMLLRGKDGKSGVLALSKGLNDLSAGAGDVVTGTTKLSSGAKDLNSGAGELASGIGTLKTGSGALVDGVKQLDDGAGALSEGMIQFNEDGIKKLVSAFDGDISGMLDKLNGMLDASKEYKNFAGISDGMDGEVKFVFVTEK